MMSTRSGSIANFLLPIANLRTSRSITTGAQKANRQLAIANLQFQKPFGWIDPNPLLCDINLNADLVRHRHHVFAFRVSLDQQDLDTPRFHPFPAYSNRPSLHASY